MVRVSHCNLRPCLQLTGVPITVTNQSEAAAGKKSCHITYPDIALTKLSVTSFLSWLPPLVFIIGSNCVLSLYSVHQAIQLDWHVQAKEVKQVGDYVAQLRRIGKGHGVFHFDQVMAEDESRLATPSSQYTT